MAQNDDIKLWPLPATWLTADLDMLGYGENAIVDGPFGSNLKVSDYIDDSAASVPVLTTRNLEGDYSDSNVRFVSKKKFEELKRSQVNPGDIIVAKIGSIGKTGIYPSNARKALIPANLLKFTVTSRVSFFFVYNYLNSCCFQKFLKKISTATAQPAFNVTKFRILPIPFPPLPEQHRIVAKIEELFSELDKGVENLKTAREQLKVYRQSMLKHAFEGRLTEKWRKEHANELEPVEVLLEKIKAEREQRYQQKLEEWQQAVKTGKRISKPAKPKELPSLTERELAELPKLPQNWKWVKIANFGNVGTGATPLKGKSEYYENGSIPWVTSGALNDNFVRQPSGFVTELALAETNLKLFPEHTLLVAMYGEGKTRGKCSELMIEATTNQAIAAIVQIGIEANIRYYLKYYLQKTYADIRRKSSGGVQPNINLGIVENTTVPLCSIAEQEAIVRQIESRLSVVDQLEQTIDDSLQKAEALRQSILKKAFEGKLVPQDPSDEPASVLLERIKAEKVKHSKGAVRRKNTVK